MTTSRRTTSHTKKYELTHFARYSLVWFCDLVRISSVGLAQAFIVATLILSLRLRVAKAGHLAVFHQNLSGGKAVPLQYIRPNIFFLNRFLNHLLDVLNYFEYPDVKILKKRISQKQSFLELLLKIHEFFITVLVKCNKCVRKFANYPQGVPVIPWYPRFPPDGPIVALKLLILVSNISDFSHVSLNCSLFSVKSTHVFSGSWRLSSSLRLLLG